MGALLLRYDSLPFCTDMTQPHLHVPAKAHDRLTWPVRSHVPSVVWQLPAEPLTPSSRSSSQASICTRSRAICKLSGHDGSLRCREPHAERLCVERWSSSACTLRRGSCCGKRSSCDLLVRRSCVVAAAQNHDWDSFGRPRSQMHAPYMHLSSGARELAWMCASLPDALCLHAIS